MAEVSLEAESGKTSGTDPQFDSEVEEEEDVLAEETLADDLAQQSVDGNVGGDDLDGSMDEIDIDGTEDGIEASDNRMQEVDLDRQRDDVATCDTGEAARLSSSVESGGLQVEHHAERVEAPQESGEADAETKVIFSLISDSQPFPHCEFLLIQQFLSLSAVVAAASALKITSIRWFLSLIGSF